MERQTIIVRGAASVEFPQLDIERVLQELEAFGEDLPRYVEDKEYDRKIRAQRFLEQSLVRRLNFFQGEISTAIADEIGNLYPDGVVRAIINFSRGSVTYVVIISVIGIASTFYTSKQLVGDLAKGIEYIVDAAVRRHIERSAQGAEAPYVSSTKVSFAAPDALSSAYSADPLPEALIRRILFVLYVMCALLIVGIAMFSIDLYLNAQPVGGAPEIEGPVQ